MYANNFNLTEYCHRIGFVGEPKANIETVRALMRCQLFTVPFENIDVQAGKIVSLVPEEIVEKIVHHPRGGYCYEVNSLFAMALSALGIEYFFVGARPMFYPARRPKTHMVIIARVEGADYLCDLGFGSYGIRAPVALAAINTVLQQDDDQYQLKCENGIDYVVQAFVAGEWVNQYGFDLYPHELLDFVPANYFNSTHPDTIFVQKLLVVKFNEKGRKILLGQQLKSIEAGVTQVKELSAEELDEVLQYEFGLENKKSPD